MDLPPMDDALAEELRLEVWGMADAYLAALLEVSTDGSIGGVYLKGSSNRPWDSEIDYVPELSDVDIHVRLTTDADSVVHSVDFAFEVARVALEGYRRRFPRPRHTPRPQLFFLERLEELAGYLPSPSGSVRTLFGREYQGGTESAYSGVGPSDVERFLADATFVQHELAGKIIDRPGRLLWQVVSSLTFRVAPAGPRLLTRLGVPPYQAWSLNRTGIVHELYARGQGSLGGHYADFYRAGWEGFRSGFSDDAAAHRAVSAACRLYADGCEVVS